MLRSNRINLQYKNQNMSSWINGHLPLQIKMLALYCVARCAVQCMDGHRTRGALDAPRSKSKIWI